MRAGLAGGRSAITSNRSWRVGAESMSIGPICGNALGLPRYSRRMLRPAARPETYVPHDMRRDCFGRVSSASPPKRQFQRSSGHRIPARRLEYAETGGQPRAALIHGSRIISASNRLPIGGGTYPFVPQCEPGCAALPVSRRQPFAKSPYGRISYELTGGFPGADSAPASLRCMPGPRTLSLRGARRDGRR